MLTMEQCIWSGDTVTIRGRDYRRITKDMVKSAAAEICKHGKHQYGSAVVEINVSVLEQILMDKFGVIQ